MEKGHTNGNSIENIHVGDLVFKDNILYGSEIIFDYKTEVLSDKGLSESDIDSKSVSLLKDLGWKEQSEIRQNKARIAEIDDYLKSKSIGSNRKGHADVYLLIDNKLKALIDNKNPRESTESGLNDAMFYANSLIKKNYDVRIVASYNGRECRLRVYDSDLRNWVPFTIDGIELTAFPSKELVELIYRYKNIHGIHIIEPSEAINISIIIRQLKETYRNVPHIQNDNQKSMDFTIAFIALKSILEKHGSRLGKGWSDLKIAEQKKLKEEIHTYVEDIINNLENGYEEIFRIKEDPKGKIKAFDFLGTINQFPNKVDKQEKGYLVKIFETIDQLPHLHSSKFDPFAEVYQSLMDKHTRKIFGQFFTPRHLIKAMIRLFYEGQIETLVGDLEQGKSVKPRLICDPACGTGGFLTESFKFLAANATGIDVNDLAKRCINGFDIYPANAVRSRINMYLAGDGFARIDPVNSSLEDLDESTKFDYILTNPPFGKGDYIVDSSIIGSKRKEVNFLIKVVKLLKPHGKAFIIVPDGILEAPTLSPLRKWMLANCEIEKIIGLPKHMFAPYTHEKTFGLFLKKRANQIGDLDEIKTERIWVHVVDMDGYANSDKRFRTGKKDKNGKWLHDELSLWRDNKGAFHMSILEMNWKKKIQPANEEYTDEWGVKIEGLKYGYIEMERIFEQKITSFQKLKKEQIKKMLREEGVDPSPEKSSDLFDKVESESDEGEKENKLKSIYESVLTAKGITYDAFEDEFYDETQIVTEQLLNLDPHTYLRPKKTITVSLEQFAKENVDLFKNMRSELENTSDWLGAMLK